VVAGPGARLDEEATARLRAEMAVNRP
jgi:hypothetical protein